MGDVDKFKCGCVDCELSFVEDDNSEYIVVNGKTSGEIAKSLYDVITDVEKVYNISYNECHVTLSMSTKEEWVHPDVMCAVVDKVAYRLINTLPVDVGGEDKVEETGKRFISVGMGGRFQNKLKVFVESIFAEQKSIPDAPAYKSSKKECVQEVANTSEQVSIDEPQVQQNKADEDYVAEHTEQDHSELQCVMTDYTVYVDKLRTELDDDKEFAVNNGELLGEEDSIDSL
jgi:hypothetical protein